MLPKCVNFQIILEHDEADRCHSQLYIPTVRILKIVNIYNFYLFYYNRNIILFSSKVLIYLTVKQFLGFKGADDIGKKRAGP